MYRGVCAAKAWPAGSAARHRVRLCQAPFPACRRKEPDRAARFVASTTAEIATRLGRPLPEQDFHLLEQRTFTAHLDHYSRDGSTLSRCLGTLIGPPIGQAMIRISRAGLEGFALPSREDAGGGGLAGANPAAKQHGRHAKEQRR